MFNKGDWSDIIVQCFGAFFLFISFYFFIYLFFLLYCEKSVCIFVIVQLIFKKPEYVEVCKFCINSIIEIKLYLLREGIRIYSLLFCLKFSTFS